jgi:hypothetical protein
MTDTLGYTGPDEAPDDYEVVELVTSSGGQAHLFRSVLRSDRLGRHLEGAEVALKQYRSGAVDDERLAELAPVVQARRHPHLARQIESFRGPAPHPRGERDEDADLHYVAHAWVPGETLDEVAHADVPVARVLAWIRQVGDALDYLHADVHDEGPVVHRDVKPSNIVVAPGGDAVLIDPGLARVVAAGATGTPWGSPGYIPPETADPAAGGPASDRWQLAATLVAALLGSPPAAPVELDFVRLQLVNRLGPEVAMPGRLADAILAMLVADPAERPTSAGAWATDLAVLAGATPGGGARVRRRLVAGAAVAALAVVAGAVALVVRDGGGSADAGAPGSGPPERVTAVIDNRVTDGMSMREDTPAYLATVPENFCRPNGCDVPGTDLASGDELVLTCQTVGQRTTNGNDQETHDDANPELYESVLWYYAVLEGSGEGYISESWIADEFRGGLDLPLC